MSFPDNGQLLYKDEYDTVYESYWETINVEGIDLLDFTSIVKTPFVWGQPQEGYVKDKQVFRKGVCITTRQIMALTTDGYEIISEGSSCVICVFSTTFKCIDGPRDIFKYHFDNAICDDTACVASFGPRYSDVDDEDVIFADLDEDGLILDSTGHQLLQFIDVWSNDENVISVETS